MTTEIEPRLVLGDASSLHFSNLKNERILKVIGFSIGNIKMFLIENFQKRTAYPKISLFDLKGIHRQRMEYKLSIIP